MSLFNLKCNSNVFSGSLFCPFSLHGQTTVLWFIYGPSDKAYTNVKWYSRMSNEEWIGMDMKGSGCCLIYKTILASDCRDCGANAQIQDINFFPENLICNSAPNLLETQLTNNFRTKVQHKTYMLIIQERLVSRQTWHVRKSVRATSLALK
jgi:hypothetical protein